MDEVQGSEFLFDISRIVKQFYETPVIFVTKKDFGDEIFNVLCNMRNALIQNVSKEAIMDIIVEFHLQWLRSVNEIENFEKRMKDVAREEIYQSISFTIDAIGNRLKYLQKYIDNLKSQMIAEEFRNIQIDIEIIEDMNKEVTFVLLEKLTCFRNFTGESEFQYKLKHATDELSDWLDKINDELAVQFAKVLKVDIHLVNDLTKSLKDIVKELSTSTSSTAAKVLEELKLRGHELSAMIRCSAARHLEISKVVDKISALDSRIKRLETQNSSAVLALVNKKKYLENRLNSLENLKSTLQEIVLIEKANDNSVDEVCPCSYEARIFNHLLPLVERDRLVTDLCYIWDKALFGERSRKSIISILSATDMKEEYTDNLGNFYVDCYGRKIYKKVDDPVLYQQNENNILVPLHDNKSHIYFYDECGRYFIDKITSQRVYKANSTASEYMMGTAGSLLKIKEERDGVTYFYDSYGRYYINDEGKHIYREQDTVSEYEHDGFGNLVRLRSHFDLFDLCADDTNVSEDSNYLKRTVGRALRESLAAVILHQPVDPIKYLSTKLKKFRENLELNDKRVKEKEELLIEREIRAAEERAAAERAAMEALRDGVSEASYDSNLHKYATVPLDDTDSMVTRTN